MIKVYKYKKLGYRAEIEWNGNIYYVAGWTKEEAKTKAEAVRSQLPAESGVSPKQSLKTIKELGALPK